MKVAILGGTKGMGRSLPQVNLVAVSPARYWAAWRTASIPTSGREPWAARPVNSTSIQTNPLLAGMTANPVGSQTTAASAA